MHDSLRLGRIAGIPVGVHWSVIGMGLLVAAVLGSGVLPAAFPDHGATDRWLAAVVGTAVFGLSLLAHELGHAVTARRYGVGVDGITLWLLGGVARLTRQAPSPTAELRIALAGPAISGLIGVVLVAAALATRQAEGGELARAVLLWIGLVNGLLAVLNLLPGAPLDGGRVLTALLWRRGGDAEHARLLSGRAGLVLGAGLGAVGLFELLVWERVAGWGTVAIGAFLVTAARTEIASAVVRGRLRRTTLAEVMVPDPPSVPDSLTVDRFLQWSASRRGVAFPVVRWGHEPIGWVSSDLVAGLAPHERSWTALGQIMLADRYAPRAWSTEAVDDVLGRLEDHLPHLVVVLDPVHGGVVGTVGALRLHGLFEGPDLWGREHSTASRRAPTGV